MSSRLSPFDTAILCSWPSLSMKVTHSSSPGLGGSTWPCRRAGLEEKCRAAITPTRTGLDRGIRGEARRSRHGTAARGNILGALLLYDRVQSAKEGGGPAVATQVRARERANILGVVMLEAWGIRRDKGGEGRQSRRRRGEGEGESEAIFFYFLFFLRAGRKIQRCGP